MEIDCDLIANQKMLEKHPFPWYVDEDEEKLSDDKDAPSAIMIRSANKEIAVAGLFWNKEARDELKAIFDFIVISVNRE
jgi:hypothetical protein